MWPTLILENVKSTFLRKMKFKFAKNDVEQLQTALHRHAPTARIAIHSMRDERAHAACSARMVSVRCFPQVAEARFEKTEVQFSDKNLNFSLPEIDVDHLHTASHRYAPLARSVEQRVGADTPMPDAVRVSREWRVFRR